MLASRRRWMRQNPREVHIPLKHLYVHSVHLLTSSLSSCQSSPNNSGPATSGSPRTEGELSWNADKNLAFSITIWQRSNSIYIHTHWECKNAGSLKQKHSSPSNNCSHSEQPSSCRRRLRDSADTFLHQMGRGRQIELYDASICEEVEYRDVVRQSVLCKCIECEVQ